MKKLLINIIKLFISGIISLIILSVFCLIYNYNGCHVTNNDGSTDYKWESNQYFSTMKEGLSWFRFDNNGYNNVNDTSFIEQPVDILLMGSSHMEAAQIGKKENVGYLLNEYLPEYRTYNIGISGHNLYSCVKNLKLAYEKYKPSKYVIIETGKIELSASLMQQVIDGEFESIESYDKGLIYYVQKNIPAIKSLYKALVDWKDVSKVSNEKKIDFDNDVDKKYIDILNLFLSFMMSKKPSDCKIIIFYHPTATITFNEDGIIYSNQNEKYEKIFSQLCEQKGIIFINEKSYFDELLLTKNKLAYGFVNTGVGVGHLNKYGHKVIAESLKKAIIQDMGGK